MKKCLSILLVLVLTLSSITVVVRAETADLSESGANTELTETGAGLVENAVLWAISIAEDDSHGYSQSRRDGPTDYDCSSLVSKAYKQAGAGISGSEKTWTMKDSYTKAGFTWIPASSIAGFPEKSTNLIRGDVLWKTGHTEMYIGNNKLVGAHCGTYDKVNDEGHPGDQTGNEISVTTYVNKGWEGVLRYKQVNAVDLGSKFYANIFPTATDSKGLATTGANEELAETGAESWLWPVPNNREITPGRGYYYINSINKHLGIDIPGNTSYDIVSTKSGIVKYVFEGCNNTGAAYSDGKSCSKNTCSLYHPATCSLGEIKRTVCNYGFGRGVVVENSDGTYACYAHMSKVNVKEKQKVSQGQVLGKMGNYGFSQGVHLHFCASKAGSSWGEYDQNLNPGEGVNYIYSVIQGQNLGEKFYANIVPTGASSSLAVTVNGSNVELGALDYSDYQKWLFERQDDGSYKITNVKTKKCLDVAGGATDDETNIRVYDSNNSFAQRWFIVKFGSGYRLVPKCTPGSAIDIAKGKISAGVNIWQYHQNDHDAQRFNIIKTVDCKDVGKYFYANILNTKSGLAVTADNTENVYIDNVDYSDNQKWLFEQQADRSYKITNVALGKCLDVAGAKKADKTNIQVYANHNHPAQRWYLVTKGNGYFFIPKFNIDGALDVDGAIYEPGRNLQEWTSRLYAAASNLDDAQRFTISKTINQKDIGTSFYANIINTKSGLAVATDETDNVFIDTADNTNDYQKWLFEQQPDKSYKITNVKANMCLDVAGAKPDNNTNIQVYPDNGHNAQRWFIASKGQGYFLIPKFNVDGALDVDGAIYEPGRNLQEWTSRLYDEASNKDAAQCFTIINTVFAAPEYVEIVPDELTLNIDEQYSLTAHVSPAEADQTITWLSENNEIATIDDHGVVTAVAPGTGYISATTVNGLMTRIAVTVTEPILEPESIVLDAESIYLDVEDTILLNATVTPAEADQTVIWRSENEDIATVDDTGLVTAVSEGNTIITVQSVDGTVQAYCSVTVFAPYIEPERVESNGYEGFVNEDDTIYLVNYQGEDRDLEIPANIDERTVNELSSYLLSQSNQYTKVTIPATITEIGYHAIGYYVSDWSDEYFHEEKLDITIYGYKNSAAEAYAQENSFTFVDIEASISTEPPTVNPAGKLIRGDADGDGTVTILDATCIQRYLAQYNVLSFDEITADADGDCEITILDATAIQRYLATFENIHHIGEPIE